MNKSTKPFLKWAGNKIHTLKHILPQFPEANRLFEPFTGSGAVFLNTDYPCYILSEINADLVDLYTHLQQEGEDFIRFCEQYFCPENNNEAVFYSYREAFNALPPSRERSALFLYLNRHCYKGLCRYRKDGGYNVPFGFYKKPYFPYQEMLTFHQKSQNAQFRCMDFAETFQTAGSGDLVYCDPPYVPLSKTSNFTSYSKEKFSESDQRRLKDMAIDAGNRGATVLISNHDTDFSRELYKDAQLFSFKVNRFIGSHTSGAKRVPELLAIYPKPV